MSEVFEVGCSSTIGNDSSAWLMVAIDDSRNLYIKVPSPDQEEKSKGDYQTRMIHRRLPDCSALSQERKPKVVEMHDGSRYLVHRAFTRLSTVLRTTTWQETRAIIGQKIRRAEGVH